MPKGVYERNKQKRSDGALTFSPKAAVGFWRIKERLEQKLPFKVSNKQVLEMLIQHYEKTEGGA